jgi:hypothetical protein
MDDQPGGEPEPRSPTGEDVEKIVRAGSACGVTLADVEDAIVTGSVGTAPARFLAPAALLRTKQTVRPKDAADREFLERLVAVTRGRRA